MSVGNPRLLKLKALPYRVTTTGLRYLKIALDIKELAGNNIGNIVEIGCGYGGQAVILDKIINIESYTFFDLWQVNMLIRRFVENSNFSSTYSLATIREDNYNCRKNWDFAISNYAFSELPYDLQKIYLDKVLKNSNKGYMTLNSGKEGQYCGLKNHSQKDLLELLPGSKVKKEIPLTGENNYVFTWG